MQLAQLILSLKIHIGMIDSLQIIMEGFGFVKGMTGQIDQLILNALRRLVFLPQGTDSLRIGHGIQAQVPPYTPLPRFPSTDCNKGQRSLRHKYRFQSVGM